MRVGVEVGSVGERVGRDRSGGVGGGADGDDTEVKRSEGVSFTQPPIYRVRGWGGVGQGGPPSPPPSPTMEAFLLAQSGKPSPLIGWWGWGTE